VGTGKASPITTGLLANFMRGSGTEYMSEDTTDPGPLSPPLVLLLSATADVAPLLRLVNFIAISSKILSMRSNFACRFSAVDCAYWSSGPLEEGRITLPTVPAPGGNSSRDSDDVDRRTSDDVTVARFSTGERKLVSAAPLLMAPDAFIAARVCEKLTKDCVDRLMSIPITFMKSDKLSAAESASNRSCAVFCAVKYFEALDGVEAKLSFPCV